MSQPYNGVSASPYQSSTGDVVVSDGLGEVVLVPRLWGFELWMRPDGGLDLRGPDGLRASAELTASGAARLIDVTVDPAAARAAS